MFDHLHEEDPLIQKFIPRMMRHSSETADKFYRSDEGNQLSLRLANALDGALYENRVSLSGQRKLFEERRLVLLLFQWDPSDKVPQQSTADPHERDPESDCDEEMPPPNQ